MHDLQSDHVKLPLLVHQGCKYACVLLHHDQQSKRRLTGVTAPTNKTCMERMANSTGQTLSPKHKRMYAHVCRTEIITVTNDKNQVCNEHQMTHMPHRKGRHGHNRSHKPNNHRLPSTVRIAYEVHSTMQHHTSIHAPSAELNRNRTAPDISRKVAKASR